MSWKNMKKFYPDSKVEVQGFSAKFYDHLMNIMTFGGYNTFIKKAIHSMKIDQNDKILDFGAGTGRNALLMNKYLSEKSEILGLEISDYMISQFEKKIRRFDNVKVLKKRIDEPLDYKDEFDKVFISFVLHGFPHQVRKIVIQNAFKALKPGGTFFILDYNEFDLNNMSLIFRIPFKIVECPYAFDFIEKDWKQILSDAEFRDYEEYLFFHKYVRLLGAKK